MKEKKGDIAKRLGVSLPTLSNYLNGRYGVSWKLALHLSAVTNTHVELWMNRRLDAIKQAIGWPE